LTNAITSAPVQADVQVARPQSVKPTTSDPKTSQTKTQAPSTVPQDTVQISSAAHKALQEATETSSQTAQEARHGDRQAQGLLAKEAAAKKP